MVSIQRIPRPHSPVTTCAPASHGTLSNDDDDGTAYVTTIIAHSSGSSSRQQRSLLISSPVKNWIVCYTVVKPRALDTGTLSFRTFPFYSLVVLYSLMRSTLYIIAMSCSIHAIEESFFFFNKYEPTFFTFAYLRNHTNSKVVCVDNIFQIVVERNS